MESVVAMLLSVCACSVDHEFNHQLSCEALMDVNRVVNKAAVPVEPLQKLN